MRGGGGKEIKQQQVCGKAELFLQLCPRHREAFFLMNGKGTLGFVVYERLWGRSQANSPRYWASRLFLKVGLWGRTWDFFCHRFGITCVTLKNNHCSVTCNDQSCFCSICMWLAQKRPLFKGSPILARASKHPHQGTKGEAEQSTMPAGPFLASVIASVIPQFLLPAICVCLN